MKVVMKNMPTNLLAVGLKLNFQIEEKVVGKCEIVSINSETNEIEVKLDKASSIIYKRFMKDNEEQKSFSIEALKTNNTKEWKQYQKSYSFEDLIKLSRKEFDLDNSWNLLYGWGLEQANYKHMLYGVSSDDKELYGLVSLVWYITDYNA